MFNGVLNEVEIKTEPVWIEEVVEARTDTNNW